MAALNEWDSLVTDPFVVLTETISKNAGKESTTILFVVVITPTFPTLIVNVKLSFTLACEGDTETEREAPGVGVFV